MTKEDLKEALRELEEEREWEDMEQLRAKLVADEAQEALRIKVAVGICAVGTIGVIVYAIQQGYPFWHMALLVGAVLYGVFTSSLFSR